MKSTEAMLGPSAVFQALAAYQETEALRAAIEIDLFTALGAGAATAKEIAARCNASERGVRILADYLVVNGFLGKDGRRYALAPVAELLASLLDAAAGRPWKVLDIAAGHGLFGITLARYNPKAEIVAVDWKNVLAVAEENARAAGIADRFQTLPGSAFEVDYGSGYDL